MTPLEAIIIHGYDAESTLRNVENYFVALDERRRRQRAMFSALPRAIVSIVSLPFRSRNEGTTPKAGQVAVGA